MKKTLLLTSALTTAALSGGAWAQSAQDIVARVQASQKTIKDLSFKVSGTANLESGAQKLDFDVQAIPAQNVARINFNAPDALADNVVVVDNKKVRNYLYLTNQITEQDVGRAASANGLDFNFSQFTDATALLGRYDVKLAETQNGPGGKVFVLEGTPKNGASERTRIWIAEQGWRPVRLQVLGGAGRVVTDLNITNYKTNSNLSSARLKALPQDAEVVRR